MASPVRYFAPVDFRTNFPALGGIRAFALTLIFYVHYGGGFTGGRIVHLLDWVRERCWFSLDLTFVLSGFLITGILYDTQADSHFFKRFFGRRAIRIFPIFYLVATLLLLLTPLLHYKWTWLQLTFLIYIGNFFATSNLGLYVIRSTSHPHMTVFISHFWSLFVEEQFYLFWPLIVWKIRDRVRLLRVAIALCAFSFVLRTIVVYTTSGFVAEHWTNHTLPFRFDTILMGGILALVLRGPEADRWQRACRWIFLAGGAIVLLILLLPSHISESLTRAVGVTFVAIASAGLVGCTLRTGSIAYRFFGMRPLRYFGRYSYGFFILHILYFEMWIQLRLFLTRKLHSPDLGGMLMFVITFAAIFLAAKVSYDLFEVRFLRLKKYFQYDAEVTSHRHGYRLK
jgi:peptidoglycan/LPS O-acetylase OafA/YrhL